MNLWVMWMRIPKPWRYKRYRDISAAYARYGRQEYEHNHYAGRTQKRVCRKENKMNYSGHERRYENGNKHIDAAVSAFNNGTEHEQQAHISHKWRKIRVPQNMAEKSDVCKRIGHGRAVHAEKMSVCPAIGIRICYKRCHAQQRKGKYYG